MSMDLDWALKIMTVSGVLLSVLGIVRTARTRYDLRRTQALVDGHVVQLAPEHGPIMATASVSMQQWYSVQLEAAGWLERRQQRARNKAARGLAWTDAELAAYDDTGVVPVGLALPAAEFAGTAPALAVPPPAPLSIAVEDNVPCWTSPGHFYMSTCSFEGWSVMHSCAPAHQSPGPSHSDGPYASIHSDGAAPVAQLVDALGRVTHVPVPLHAHTFEVFGMTFDQEPGSHSPRRFRERAAPAEPVASERALALGKGPWED